MTDNLGLPTEETIASKLRDGRAVELFDVLSDKRRLWVVDHLFDADGPVSITTLARMLTAIETDTSMAAQSRESSRPAYISLHHRHVPKLVQADVVVHNEDRQTLELADSVELSPLLATFFVEHGMETSN
ncbi:hypothetical protein AUR64_10050 [Haloprofundus marisrubri]|uniref:DUF7344 domain-containing protein n=1 Tax=Haloprofundus marisrubri TaxID=1514971 RepID=A0A0W1R906_9EURY|nr:hypothetical protein [Haloprofundus marisrubri]KTG09948.1 hypothetical protein AUR64_10050 [Haloprofundus marisrubri]